MSAMTLVVIESPYAGDVERNLTYARRAMRWCLDKGLDPCASPLLYTQDGVLDDDDPEDRELGIDSGFEWAAHADAAVFFLDYGMSRGMSYAMEHWLEQGKRIVEVRIWENP